MMKKSNALLIAFRCAVVLIASAAVPAHAKELTVATFGGGQGEAARNAFVKPYQAATGVKVNLATTENSLGVIRAMASANPAKWDVMDVAMATAGQACKEGLLVPIDKSKLPMADLAQGSVTECAVSIPKAGSVLIYNKNRFGNNPPKSWADFWDVKRFPGKRAMTRYIQDAAFAALLADGVAPADVNKKLREPATRDRVFAKLNQIRDNLVWVSTGAELVQGLVSGSYDIALGWNARVNTANEETGGRFAVVWNAGFGLDGAASVIPITAAHPDLAMEYIAFTARAEQQAQYMKIFPYGSANRRAYDRLTAEQRDLLPSSPDKLKYAVVADNEFWSEHSSDWQKALEAWIARK